MTSTTAGDLTDALLTMDIADRLRREQQDLSALVNAHDQSALRARLKAIYESQGIAVSDDILDAAIKAQRDRKFVYSAPTGLLAGLARLWVDRVRIGWVSMMLIGVIVAAQTVFYLSVTAPAERRAYREYQAYVEAYEARDGRASELALKLESQKAAFVAASAALIKQWSGAKEPRFLAVKSQSVASSAAIIEQKLMELRNLKLQRVTELEFSASKSTFTDSLVVLSQLDEAIMSSLMEIGSDTLAVISVSKVAGVVTSLVERIRSEPAVWEPTESVVAPLLAKAWQALDAGNSSAGSQIVANIEAIGTLMTGVRTSDQQIEGYKVRLAALPLDEAAAVKSRQLIGEADAAIASLRSAIALDPAIRQQKTRDVERIVDVLGSTVDLIEKDLVFKITKRKGVRAGVWRKHATDPSLKNYYLIVEPTDATGASFPMEMTSEEDGSVEKVDIFGVRVSEARFDAVQADWKDDRIIQNNQVGSKPAGALKIDLIDGASPGFILSW